MKKQEVKLKEAEKADVIGWSSIDEAYIILDQHYMKKFPSLCLAALNLQPQIFCLEQVQGLLRIFQEILLEVKHLLR